MIKSDAFAEEMRLVSRAMALCLIRHSIADFFSIDLTWPNPAQELEGYKELVGCPGVFQVKSTGGSPDGALTIKFVDVHTGM